MYILPSGTMFSGDFEAGEFASRGVIIYVDGGSYDGALDGRRSNRGHLDPTHLSLVVRLLLLLLLPLPCPCSEFSPFHCAPDSHPHPAQASSTSCAAAAGVFTKRPRATSALGLG